MKIKNMSIGIFLILIGIVFSLSSMNLGTAQTFNTVEKYNDSWASFGSFNGTTSVDSNIVLSNPQAGDTGYYYSDILEVSEADRIQLNGITYEGSDITNKQTGTLTIRGHDGFGVVEFSETYQLENGVNSIDIANYTDTDIQSYSFDVSLSTETTGETASFNEINFDLTSYSDNDIGGDISKILYYILIGLGLVVIVTDVLG